MASLVLPVRAAIQATPRTRIIHSDLSGSDFQFKAGQAVFAGLAAGKIRRPYSIACSPTHAREQGMLELLVQIDDLVEGRRDLAVDPAKVVSQPYREIAAFEGPERVEQLAGFEPFALRRLNVHTAPLFLRPFGPGFRRAGELAPIGGYRARTRFKPQPPTSESGL